jgi:hypothetical protein
MIYDMMWYDMIWYMIWYDTKRYDTIRYDIWYYIWYDWYDMIWYDMIYDMILYDVIWHDMIYFLTVIWVATRWQQYSTHLHTNNTQNDTKQTIHRTTQKYWKFSARRAPSLRVLPWHLPYNRGKTREIFSQGSQIIFGCKGIRGAEVRQQWI